jgi:hypothetical protein
MVTWLPEATADSTTGLLATQSVALICVAILAQTISGVTFVRVAGADPSELDTFTGPALVALSVMLISLPYVPPSAALQFGSDTLI